MQQGLYINPNQAIAAVVASGLMVSICNIQMRTNAVDALGQVDLTDWVNVAGLTGLVCQLSVQREGSPDQSGVLRQPTGYDEIAQRHCLLNGYYPTILRQYTAVIDGTRYELMAVESDSQQTMTRLAVRTYGK